MWDCHTSTNWVRVQSVAAELYRAEIKPQTTYSHGPGSPLRPEATQPNHPKDPNRPPPTASTWEGSTHLYVG